MLRLLFQNRRLEYQEGFKDTLKHPLSHEECVSLEFCLWELGSSLTREGESEPSPCLQTLGSHEPAQRRSNKAAQSRPRSRVFARAGAESPRRAWCSAGSVQRSRQSCRQRPVRCQ